MKSGKFFLHAQETRQKNVRQQLSVPATVTQSAQQEKAEKPSLEQRVERMKDSPL